LTTPIGPPRLWVRQRSAAMRRAHLGPGQPALASRDATAGPGPISSIRKGSFFFKDLSRSLG
jgi:hypothetical protein